MLTPELQNRNRKKSVYKPVLASYERVFSFSEDTDCYELSERHVSLILRTAYQFRWPTRWTTEIGGFDELEYLSVVDLIDSLYSSLTNPLECCTDETVQNKPTERYREKEVYSREIETLLERIAELEEEIEEMACKCPELKFINGVLHQSYIDDCGCKKWQKVPTEGGGGLNGSQGSSLGGALLDKDGKAIPDSRLDIEPVELTQRNYEIEACSKATALVDIVLATMEGLLEGNTQWQNLGDAVGLPLGTWAEAMAGFFLSSVPALAPAVVPAAIARLAKELTQPVRDELSDKLSDENLRETLICQQAKTMIRDADVFGEELESVLDSFALGVTAYAAVSAALHMWDLQKIQDILRIAVYNNDCGCPELTQQQSYSPANPPQKPSAAVWSVEANLNTGQHGTRLFEIGNPSWGSYQSGTGYVNSSFDFEDVEDATQFTRILIDWESLSGRILRVDWYAENVVEGLFQSNSGTPNADIEKFLVYVSPDQQTRQYVDNGAGWRSANFGQTFANIDLWWFWGYCEIDSNGGGQTSPGQGTVTKIRIHGTGTKPAWFAANGWTDV